MRKIQTKRFIPIFCLGGCLFLSSCVKRKIYIKTSAYACSESIPNGFLLNKSFTLAGDSYENGIKQNNCELQTNELKKKISFILKERGYSTAEGLRSDYILTFNYGINSEEMVENVLKYIPGETTYTSGSITNNYGHCGQYNGRSYCSDGGIINTSGSLTGSGSHYGQYNQTETSYGSFICVPERYVLYTKFLRFYVYDTREYLNRTDKDKMPPQIWYGIAWGADRYADLRTYLDYLLIQLFDVLGKNIESVKELYEDDEIVTWLRQETSK